MVKRTNLSACRFRDEFVVFLESRCEDHMFNFAFSEKNIKIRKNSENKQVIVFRNYKTSYMGNAFSDNILLNVFLTSY